MKQNLRWYLVGALLIVSVLIGQAVWAEASKKDLTVAFMDVGQGDGIFIEAPNGVQMIVDGGPDRKILGEIKKLMPFYDRTIDLIVVTNPDKDHMAGFIDILKNYEVGKVLEPGTTTDTKVYAEFEKSVENEKSPLRSASSAGQAKGPEYSRGAEKIIARRNMRIILDQQNKVYFDILFPDRDVSDWKTNDGSIVGKLIYGNQSFLLTGDTIKGIENYLVNLDPKSLDTDVLKLAHHGSKTSSSEELLEAASPLYAVISAGFNNRYGHPHQEVLDRLEKNKIPYLGTYDKGTVVFKTDGKKLQVVNQVN